MMPECLDKLGHHITVGCYIVYGHALGRCAGLRIGKVLGIRQVEKPPWGGVGEPTHEWRIRVQGVDDDGLTASGGPKLCKPGTLQFPSRIVVIEAGDMPLSYLTLLESP